MRFFILVVVFLVKVSVKILLGLVFLNNRVKNCMFKVKVFLFFVEVFKVMYCFFVFI